MSHYCDTHTITGLTSEAEHLNCEVRNHIEANAGLRQYSSMVWLPAVCSEDDADLRDMLEADLGQPTPSGYMSEESGWDVSEYVVVDSL